MKWVTRENAAVDRIACPWLIRRFVDPDAEFLFVAPEEVQQVATREGATPFDVEERSSATSTAAARSRACSSSSGSCGIRHWRPWGG